MRASSQAPAQPPQPLPLPLPPPPLSLPSPPPAPRRGRHRASSSSSSSSFCPSPSHAASPPASTASLVPFSWERHPGVPKNSFRGGFATGAPLPLPPQLCPSPRLRANAAPAASSGPGGASNSDPFVAAFAECTRDGDGDDGTDHGADTHVSVADKLWPARTKPKAPGRAERRWRLDGGGLVGFLDLYGCKSAVAIADGAFFARRPVMAHGRASRRKLVTDVSNK